MLKREISYTFGGQAALNDHGLRSPSHNSRKGSVEFLGSAYRDGLNLNTGDTASKFNLLKN
jgi:hypothetical protein